MPEQNKKIISKYQGESNPDKRYLKLGRKITDVVSHKIFGVTSEDPEYWGLKEVLTPEMCDVANKMKLRKDYTFEELKAMNPELSEEELQNCWMIWQISALWSMVTETTMTTPMS